MMTEFSQETIKVNIWKFSNAIGRIKRSNRTNWKMSVLSKMSIKNVLFIKMRKVNKELGNCRLGKLYYEYW